MPPCLNLMDAARSVQLLKINGFTATATKETPGYAASRICTVGGHDWQIQFHPNRRNNCVSYSSADWILFRLGLISKASGVAASFSCCLVDQNSTYPRTSKEKRKSARFYQNHFVDIFLMEQKELDDSQYLKDECIIVQCAITVLLSETKDAEAANAAPSVPSSDLHNLFCELLRSQKGTDVMFSISGESVAAHRCVLAARSTVFMAELFGDMKENSSSVCIEVKDMEVEVFRVMLHFIYTDTVPELEQEGEQASLMAQHLLEAADRYGLERLKRICIEKVCTSISLDTVATTLALAAQHGCAGCAHLKSRCMKFILATPENLEAVVATEGYNHLEASCPSVLTELLKVMGVQNKKLIAKGNK